MSGPEGTTPMDSEILRQRVRLYLYGELSLAERHEVERCRAEDPAFHALVEDEETFLLALGEPQPDTDIDGLLEECREGLGRAVAMQQRPQRVAGPLSRIRRALGPAAVAIAGHRLVWQPALAALLVAVGYWAGSSNLRPRLRTAEVAPSYGLTESFSADASPMLTGVETVRLDPVGGQVQIVFEERRIVTGESSDPFIRGMLLNTVLGSHAGARLSSLEALRVHADDREVRQTLLRSLIEDENPGVRLMALDAIRDQAGLPEVRRALLQALRHDPNTGMRVHAIQLLREYPGRDLAGPLQDLVKRESNSFVLDETERILQSLGASMEHY